MPGAERYRHLRCWAANRANAWLANRSPACAGSTIQPIIRLRNCQLLGRVRPNGSAEMTYWDNMLSSRISRRRSLGLTGGGAAAAFLVACGGGGSSEKSPQEREANSALPKQVDTTKQAVAGGEFHERIANDSNYYLYDSNFNTSGNPGIAGWIYPHFTKAKVGSVDSLPTGEVVGDFAESFELSPDGLKATFKIRPNRSGTRARRLTAASPTQRM